MLRVFSDVRGVWPCNSSLILRILNTRLNRDEFFYQRAEVWDSAISRHSAVKLLGFSFSTH